MAIEQSSALFLQEKPVRSLLLIKKDDKHIYASIIAKEIDSTYAHTLNVLFSLKEIGLIVFEKKGRIKHVKITELGKKVADILENFIDVVHLSELTVRVERVFEKMVRDSKKAKLDQAAVNKRLAPYKKELERLSSKGSVLKELSKNLTKRIEEISKDGATHAGP